MKFQFPKKSLSRHKPFYVHFTNVLFSHIISSWQQRSIQQSPLNPISPTFICSHLSFKLIQIFQLTFIFAINFHFHFSLFIFTFFVLSIDKNLYLQVSVIHSRPSVICPPHSSPVRRKLHWKKEILKKTKHLFTHFSPVDKNYKQTG